MKLTPEIVETISGFRSQLSVFDTLRDLADHHSDTKASREILDASVLGNELIRALEGIFAQTNKHARNWGQAESARAFASDPATAHAFSCARSILLKAKAQQ